MLQLGDVRMPKDYSPRMQPVNLIFNGTSWTFLREKKRFQENFTVKLSFSLQTKL